MTLTGRTIASNTVFYSAALTIQKALAFIYFSFLARSLGATLTGKYFFALSIGGIVAGLIDIGLTPILTREVAKNTSEASEIVSAITTVKTLLVALLGILAVLFVPQIFPDELTRQLIYISLAIAAVDSFALSFFAAIRAHQNLFYESLSAIGFYIVVITLGGYAIFQGADLRLIIAMLGTASVANALYAFLVLTRRLQIRVRLQWDPMRLHNIARAAAPFALAAVFLKVYAYSDTVLLKFFIHDTAVGWYSIPYKITFAFQFIPLAFVASLFPAFAYYWQHNRVELGGTFMKACHYLLVISMPIAGGIAAVAPQLIPFLYTDAFRPSILPLAILISSLPFLFLNFPIGSLLNACDRQLRQTTHIGITMALNVVLNLILIPRFGVLGAAAASTVSTIFIFALGLYAASHTVSVMYKPLFVSALKIGFSTTTMMLVIWVIDLRYPWYFSLAPAVITYALLAALTRAVTMSEIRSFIAIVRRR